MTSISPAPRRNATGGGGGGGGGTTLPAAAHDRQVLRSHAAASSGVQWADFPFASLTDYGGVADNTTDNRAAFDAAFADMAPNGGTLMLPPGRIALATAPTVPNNVRLLGAMAIQWNGNAGTAVPVTGTILRPTAGHAALILGADITLGEVGATLENLAVFAYNQGPDAVSVAGPKARIINCIIYGGTVNGVAVSNGGFKAIGTDVLMNQGGNAWNLGNNDAHIVASVTQGYQNGILHGGGGLYVGGGCHFFTATIAGSNDIRITGRGAVQITGNTFENCMGDVFAIVPSAGVACNEITIASNHCYAHSGNRPADTSGLLRLNANAAGSSISGIVFGSTFMATGNRDLYLANATGDVTQWSMSQVSHSHAQHILAAGSVAPDVGMSACSVNPTANPGRNVLRSGGRGFASFVGDGSNGPFTITHTVDGIGGAAPRNVMITAGTADASAAGFPSATLTSTQIAITTPLSPPVGANLGYYWEVTT